MKKRVMFDWFVGGIKTSRPVLWLVNLASLIIGVIAGGGGSLFQVKYLFAAILVSFPYSLFVYSINDYYDAESDSINTRKGGAFGLKYKKEGLDILKLYSFIGFIVTLIGLSVISKGVVGIYLLISMLLYLYSANPIRLKAIPVVDFVVGGGIFVMSSGLFGYLMSGNTVGSLLADFPIGLFSLFAIGMIMHLIGAIFDIESDKSANMMTSAVFFGYRKMAWFGIIISIVSVLFAKVNIFYSFLTLVAGGLAGLQLFSSIRESDFFKIFMMKLFIIAFFLLVFGMSLVDMNYLR
ncbi:UbiA family prenyltransferase [Patescibacteria group bacterium]